MRTFDFSVKEKRYSFVNRQGAVFALSSPLLAF